MEAKFYQKGDVTVVNLSGRLEIEKTQPFRHACMHNLKGRRVVFCMQELNFVGSTGIQGFFQIIRDFNISNEFKAKIVGLKPDFQRLLVFSNLPELEFCESVNGALQGFHAPALEIK